ncbi:hypothetical protein [Mycobacteroides abscessus]|uniref:hypothetical protein n=1 Tax=Mycobacteroides abscessus TaxID=36809 RepID=UPI000928E908|nr:hypothetical protein [Mycobacteroides abscessus]DAZ90319.1 TPA_asm: hypothetical protein PROPHIFSQJ01-1_33 [Mycobacterium phage prophiFSQJ01-1]SII40715.1 Uncharacterised protein [Mycobacteroides abscessus subsp. abscessus]SIK14506.1 Uncharacterised protein [Mycobacteroides abscessus subsp. abscessus]SIN25207.1 Uncharacterised protein [Mycobacteroides abscessus subsp. abscessus]SLI51710.1 Uncharacterised protein [Mycobacteroides abscessus subsp. abscessus]
MKTREEVLDKLDSLRQKVRRYESLLAKLPEMPKEPFGTFTVVRFKKIRERDGQSLTYAAIRNGDQWTLTQHPSSNYPQNPRRWADLMNWIGQDQWHTVEVMSARSTTGVPGAGGAGGGVSVGGILIGPNPPSRDEMKLRGLL